MDHTILKNLNFKKIENINFDFFQSFNPNRIATNREKYVLENNLDIFERIYIKI